MTNEQIIQISKDLGKIKGMEKSKYILTSNALNDLLNLHEQDTLMMFAQKKIGPWLRNSIFDGEWSSAAIRAGLKLDIDSPCLRLGYEGKEFWCLRWREIEKGKRAKIQSIFLDLSDPAADELAQMLGIIEYHKHFPQEVEDYLKGLK